MTQLAAYRTFWHPLAKTDEIDESPRRFTLLGEAVVAFKTSAGFSVFRDVCPHRGCALSLGRIVEEKLECPYHGWQFDAQGKCVRIPALAPTQPIPTKARTVAYETRVDSDILWVTFEPASAPFPLAPEECRYGRPELRSVIVGTYEWNADAGRVVENFLDVSHFPFVHDGSLGDRAMTFVTPHEVNSSADSFEYVYPQLQPTDPTTGGAEPLYLNFSYCAPFSAHIKRQTSRDDWSCVSLYSAPTTAVTSRTFVTFTRNFDLDPSSDHKYCGFVHGAMVEDGTIVQSLTPVEIPLDMRAELHIGVPDAAGLHFRRVLARIEAAAQKGSQKDAQQDSQKESAPQKQSVLT